VVRGPASSWWSRTGGGDARSSWWSSSWWSAVSSWWSRAGVGWPGGRVRSWRKRQPRHARAAPGHGAAWANPVPADTAQSIRHQSTGRGRSDRTARLRLRGGPTAARHHQASLRRSLLEPHDVVLPEVLPCCTSTNTTSHRWGWRCGGGPTGMSTESPALSSVTTPSASLRRPRTMNQCSERRAWR